MSSDRYWPIVLPMPINVKERIELLHTLFSSRVVTEILSLFKDLEASLYQREIVEKLSHHSNRTVIEALKKLVKLGILEEITSVERRGGRKVRVKLYRLTDLGKWYSLLMRGPESIDREVLRNVIAGLLSEIVRRVSMHSRTIGLELPDLVKLFCRSVIEALAARSAIQNIKAVVLGSLAIDHYIEIDGDGHTISYARYLGIYPGGNGGNVASVLSRMGMETAFFGKVAADLYGAILVYASVADGIDMSAIEVDLDAMTVETVVTVNRASGCSKILCLINERSALSPLSLSEKAMRYLESCQGIYVGEVFHEVASRALEIAHRHSVTAIYRPILRALKVMPKEYLSPLRYEPILVLNEEKMGILMAMGIDVDKLFSYGAKHIVITMGEKGAILYEHGRKVRYVPPRIEVVDTAGAGDTLSAVLLYALLRGLDLEHALRVAVLAATYSVASLGPRWSPKPFDQLEAESRAVAMEII